MLTYKLFLESIQSDECMDCHKKIKGNTEDYYMVHDEIWEEGVQSKDRIKLLCLDCLEKRLRRKLKVEDFTDYPINDVVKKIKSESINESLFFYKKILKNKYEKLISSITDYKFTVKVDKDFVITEKKKTHFYKVDITFKNILTICKSSSFFKRTKENYLQEEKYYNRIDSNKLQEILLKLNEESTYSNVIFEDRKLHVKLYVLK